MLYTTGDKRLIHADTEEEWRRIPYFNGNRCRWFGDKLSVCVGKNGNEGNCDIDMPDIFPCNIYIEGYGSCHARIINNKAATAYLHECVDKELDAIERLQYDIRYCLQFERHISGIRGLSFYPDDYEPSDDTEE